MLLREAPAIPGQDLKLRPNPFSLTHSSLILVILQGEPTGSFLAFRLQFFLPLAFEDRQNPAETTLTPIVGVDHRGPDGLLRESLFRPPASLQSLMRRAQPSHDNRRCFSVHCSRGKVHLRQSKNV